MQAHKRADAWSKDHDFFVIQTVLDYIRTGKTQIEAFEIAAEHLDRTAAAVGFRWNSILRDYCPTELEEAKRERLALKRKNGIPFNESSVVSEIGNLEKRVRVLISRNRWLDKELQKERREKERLMEQLQDLHHFASILRKMNESQKERST